MPNAPKEFSLQKKCIEMMEQPPLTSFRRHVERAPRGRRPEEKKARPGFDARSSEIRFRRSSLTAFEVANFNSYSDSRVQAKRTSTPNGPGSKATRDEGGGVLTATANGTRTDRRQGHWTCTADLPKGPTSSRTIQRASDQLAITRGVNSRLLPFRTE
ncbi:hypothetical protein EVAR_101944_1 [Eumeta japonica]|uniref:Uncharacterized protein n=1 Tax=Eumeta variegata TaxID=151549 RepID=A0A4C1TSD5_EUMVA|nr:hypothetical protein EVAR_101944_1 [Eumeta japonica]